MKVLYIYTTRAASSVIVQQEPYVLNFLTYTDYNCPWYVPLLGVELGMG